MKSKLKLKPVLICFIELKEEYQHVDLEIIIMLCPTKSKRTEFEGFPNPLMGSRQDLKS